MTVLDRFKDTDKYPRRLREKFATLIGLRDEKALFLKKEEMCFFGEETNVLDTTVRTCLLVAKKN